VCYNNLPTIIVLGWVGLLNYGCKVYVLLYTQDTQHRIGHPLCFGTIVDPKENNALELWEAQDPPPKAPSSWPPYTPVLSLFFA
jgi:hypothetical protein